MGDGPPGQDSSLWGQILFAQVGAPVDWCTVRQAQEHKNEHTKPDNLLEQIACGKVESAIYSPAEAKQLLEALHASASKERK